MFNFLAVFPKNKKINPVFLWHPYSIFRSSLGFKGYKLSSMSYAFKSTIPDKDNFDSLWSCQALFVA